MSVAIHFYHGLLSESNYKPKSIYAWGGEKKNDLLSAKDEID